MDAFAANANPPVVALLERHRVVVEAVVDGGRRAAVVALVVVGRERVVDRPRPLGDVARPRGRGLDLAVLVGSGEAHVVDPLVVAVARDDVDGAGDRPSPGLGGRRAQDLDPLDLVGRDRIERKARRHTLAVEQDLGVAVAEAAQPDRTAAAGAALDRHAGQALQHVAERRVAEAVDLLAADDDLGGGRLAALLHVVGPGAGDAHRRQLLGLRGRCRFLRRWSRCRGCGCGGRRGRATRRGGLRERERRHRECAEGSAQRDRRRARTPKPGPPRPHETSHAASLSPGHRDRPD